MVQLAPLARLDLLVQLAPLAQLARKDQQASAVEALLTVRRILTVIRFSDGHLMKARLRTQAAAATPSLLRSAVGAQPELPESSASPSMCPVRDT